MPHYVANTARVTKQRHPLLSMWLALIIIYSVTFTALSFSGAGVVSPAGSASGWAVPALMALLILQTICAVALFNWKKWGFWGYCAVNAIGLVVDVMLNINLAGPSIAVLVGIAGLYGALQIGQENKVWPQLD